MNFVGVGPAGALFLSTTTGSSQTLYRAVGGVAQQRSATTQIYSAQPATLVGEDTFLLRGGAEVLAMRSREFGIARVRDGAGDPFVASWLGASLGPLAFAAASSGWFAIDSATLRATPLRPDAAPAQAVVVGGRWIISAADGLWTSDGTAAGTRLALSVSGGVATVVELPAGLLVIGSGGQLSLADTALSQATPLQALAGPQLVGVYGGNAILAADSGLRLYRTDGRTVTAYATLPTPPFSVLDAPSAAGLVFAAGAGLMVTDGTAGGTRSLGPELRYSAKGAVRLGGRLLFCGYTNPQGTELWSTDGTPAGTTQVVDLYPGTASGCVAIWSPFEGQVLFAGDNGFSGQEPYVTDGTAGGTRLLADLIRGGDARVSNLAPLGPEVVFSALDGSGALQVQRTVSLTRQLAPLLSQAYSYITAPLLTLGGRVLFQAQTAEVPLSLFATDGTTEGTLALAPTDLFRQSAVSQGTLFYPGAGAEGVELWSTQGTAASTRLSLDLVPGPSSASPSDLVADGDRLWFVARGASGRELWLRRGDDARMVKDLAPGPLGSTPRLLTPAAGRLFFSAFEPTSGRELFVSDGTADSTRRVLELEPGPDSAELQVLTAFGDGVLLGARRLTGHGELWRVDREGARPTRLAQFAPGVTVSAVRVLDDQAWFTVGPDAPELWRTDGTPEGTAKRAAVPGNGRLETVGNVLYFDAADDASGLELRRWLPNAAAPELVVDTAPGPASARLDAFVETDAGVFFAVYEASSGSTLWSVQADVSGPRVEPRFEGTLGAGGFYTSEVRVRFEVSDEASEVYAQTGCEGGTLSTDSTATFTCTASSLGGTTRSSVTVKRDATAPALACPERLSLPAGAALRVELSVSDAVDPSPALVVAPPLGTVLSNGTTLVDVAATDAAGNLGTCSVRVDVGGEPAPPQASCGCASGEGATLALLGGWLARRRRPLREESPSPRA